MFKTLSVALFLLLWTNIPSRPLNASDEALNRLKKVAILKRVGLAGLEPATFRL